MHGTDVSGWKRILAGIMGCLLLVMVLFSALYIVEEAEHDCCGETCPICACIEACTAILRPACSGAVKPLCSALCLMLLLRVIRLLSERILVATPVSQKVQLNN